MKSRILNGSGTAFRPLLLLLVLLLVFFGARAIAADDLREGQLLLERATEGLFNESSSPAQLRELLDGSLEAFASIEQACTRDYWRSRASYLYGFVEQGEDRAGEAEQRFQQGFDWAESSLNCGEFSEGYRLLADTQAQLLAYHGMVYAMKHGPMVRDFAEKALELDPANAKARINLALYYKNAPAIAGGNEKKARRILREIESSEELEPLDRFSVNVWLGISYAETDDPETARRYLEQAQMIFPGNTWLQEIKAENSL